MKTIIFLESCLGILWNVQGMENNYFYDTSIQEKHLVALQILDSSAIRWYLKLWEDFLRQILWDWKDEGKIAK